jgi:Protein of unknown function (DUF5672)
MASKSGFTYLYSRDAFIDINAAIGLSQTMQSSARRRLSCIAIALFVVIFIFYWTRPSLQASFKFGSPVENASPKPAPLKHPGSNIAPFATVDKPTKSTPVVKEPSAAVETNTSSTVDTQIGERPSSGGFTIGKKVAAIIEDRPMANLIPLILHFSSVLGPDWPIILFTSLKNVTESAPFMRAIKGNVLKIHALPDGLKFTNHQSVSNFLARTWFWEQLAPAEHVLLFQADSILCANAPQTVDDYLQYDFVGAPIDAAYGEGFNGGLSLRNRQMTLDIIEANLPEDGGDILGVGFEDQWFHKKMLALSPKPNGKPGANLPPVDVAKTFAVETIYYDRPLGYHQVTRWQNGNIEEIAKWCPEYSLCTSDLIITHG